ncbi:hypothetical protein VTN77DRAFT_8748 [Rasamsonia byssochlamydoides]|uniref:uncharacterized protein n=1 Tax=Rasamsonia byssochlamydoides TaxID=89139 RepID=UPI0037421FEB
MVLCFSSMTELTFFTSLGWSNQYYFARGKPSPKISLSSNMRRLNYGADLGQAFQVDMTFERVAGKVHEATFGTMDGRLGTAIALA